MSRKRERERALFGAFYQLEPEFLGEAVASWDQPLDERDFPDIVGRSITGRKVGVEIVEWLNEEEIKAAKQQERLEQEVLQTIGEQGVNPTGHISHVWLFPKGPIASRDAAGFRDQLFASILECDRRWPDEPYWRPGHRLVGEDLARYPLLARYLDAIHLFPAEARGQWEENWITFRLRGGVFGRETMFKPLREAVAEKVGHYSTNRTGLDHISLLVVYDQAWIYNPPAETPFHTFEDAAAELREMIGDGRGVFERAFLYIATEPGRVLRVW